MNPLTEPQQNRTRRHFFSQGGSLLGGAALATLLGSGAKVLAADDAAHDPQGLDQRLTGVEPAKILKELQA